MEAGPSRRPAIWRSAAGFQASSMICAASIRFEALILPLADDGMQPDMVLAAQIMDEA